MHPSGWHNPFNSNYEKSERPKQYHWGWPNGSLHWQNGLEKDLFIHWWTPILSSFNFLLSYITKPKLPYLPFKDTPHQLIQTNLRNYPTYSWAKKQKTNYFSSCPLVERSKPGPLNPSAATSRLNPLFLTSSPIRLTINGRPRASFIFAWCAYQC